MQNEPKFVTRQQDDTRQIRGGETNEFWMTKREFGSFNESAAKVNRLRRLVIIFGSIVFVLAASLAFVTHRWVSNSEDSGLVEMVRQPVTAGPQIAHASTVPMARILITNRRVPKGEEFTEEMFRMVDVQLTDLPAGSLHSDQLPLVIGKFASASVSARAPLLAEHVSDLPVQARQLTPFYIPAGHRAIAIRVDTRTSVEGFAKPGTIVDVLWIFTDKDGTKKLTKIVPRAKVLSVGGQTDTTNTGQTKNLGATITLLVTERDAKIIELAQNLGSMSLTLVSEEDEGVNRADTNTPVTVRDIFRRVEARDSDTEPVDGYLMTFDRRTGLPVRYVLDEGRWKVERKKKNKTKAAESARARPIRELPTSKEWMGRHVGSAASTTQ